jgi:predicted transcriptional regulator
MDNASNHSFVVGSSFAIFYLEQIYIITRASFQDRRKTFIVSLYHRVYIFFPYNCEKNNNELIFGMSLEIGNIAEILKAKVLTPDLDVNREVDFAFSSDLMSDVLTGDYHKTVLITGLSNLQSIRTAEMSDISEVIIGRNKEVSQEMIDLAMENDIFLIRSSYSLFRISGLLFKAGIKPVF